MLFSEVKFLQSLKEVANKEVNIQILYVAQFPTTLVCNRYNFMNMHEKVLIFLPNKVLLLTFKILKGWLPSLSIKEIMEFLARLVSCPVSGQLV